MSNDETPHVPVRRDRREAVREKAAQVQATQRRNSVIRVSIISLVVAAVVVGAGAIVTWTLVSAASRPQLSPSGITGDAIVIDTLPTSVLAAFQGGAGADAAPTATGDPSAAEVEPTEEATPEPTPESLEIAIYVDYLSPASAEFQAANAQQLTEWVSEGAATIAYHPVAMLTAKSNGTKYSLRAAAAGACVATYAEDSFFVFNNELLAKQPEMDTDGFNDSELAALAIAAGGASDPKTLRACIEDQDFVSWAQQATERALGEPLGDSDATLTGPTVLVNGTPYVGAIGDPKEFAQFVLTLASDAYYSTPTPTPSATPTPSPSTTP